MGCKMMWGSKRVRKDMTEIQELRYEIQMLSKSLSLLYSNTFTMMVPSNRGEIFGLHS